MKDFMCSNERQTGLCCEMISRMECRMARLTISNTSTKSTKTAIPCQMGRELVGGCVKGSLSAETVSSRAAPGVAADVCGMLRTSTLMSSFLEISLIRLINWRLTMWHLFSAAKYPLNLEASCSPRGASSTPKLRDLGRLVHDICNDSRRRFKLMPSNRLLPYASCVPMRLYPPHMIVGFATGPPILSLSIRLAWDAMFGIGVCVHSPGAASFRGLTLQDYPGQGGYGGWLARSSLLPLILALAARIPALAERAFGLYLQAWSGEERASRARAGFQPSCSSRSSTC